MPELPEVETFARDLAARTLRQRVQGCRLLFAPLLKNRSPHALRRLRGQTVEGLARRGKYLIIRFQGGLRLVFHLKMTGQFRFVGKGSPADRHTRLVLSFRDLADDLHFRDVRKFGCLYVFDGDEADARSPLGSLGAEPLALSQAEFLRLLRGRRARLKSLLLNQNVIAGIGNIYADEILFRSGLHPLRPVSSLDGQEIRRLLRGIRSVLRRAIARGGSSIRDYAASDGRPGRAQEEHCVYGRESEPCVRCGLPIERLVIGGRSSHYCPRCQPRGRPKCS